MLACILAESTTITVSVTAQKCHVFFLNHKVTLSSFDLLIYQWSHECKSLLAVNPQILWFIGLLHFRPFQNASNVLSTMNIFPTT